MPALAIKICTDPDVLSGRTLLPASSMMDPMVVLQVAVWRPLAKMSPEARLALAQGPLNSFSPNPVARTPR